MYLTSFIHREALFNIAERWFCGCPEPGDVRTLTEILIYDGFVIGETLKTMTELLLGMVYDGRFHQRHIRSKGELRDLLSIDARDGGPRVADLVRRYRENPDYYYRETPINAVMCLDGHEHLLGLFRIKRPKRIAEKVNRKITNWIFENVLKRAGEMAEVRAKALGVPLERFVTPPGEMVREFVSAEESVAHSFRDGGVRFERDPLTVHDVAAIKIVAGKDGLKRLETRIASIPEIRVVEREVFNGDYKAINLVLEVPWDAGHVCRQYRESEGWKKYLCRGIPEEELKKGLEPFLDNVEPKVNIELILSTFPDMVESELGSSIHEKRIVAQRDSKLYKGYIPMNVEFLAEALFAVGFSPRTDFDRVPIKLWGRYLPETLSSYIRQLHNLPEHDLFY
ncbi:MAG TPA: hypothetical protein VN328_10400 [Thermodesulfovibrionales bacterium]|nr:hypothetical protein [Thermodesulfovibrionales bacterium]